MIVRRDTNLVGGSNMSLSAAPKDLKGERN